MKHISKLRMSYSVVVLTSFFVLSGTVFASEISKEGIINLVNQSRIENGSQVLLENDKLNSAAKDKVDDMIKNNYFAHTSPSGTTPWHWFEKNGYDYKYAGENLALGFSSVENEHKAWMESPTHKKNILNDNYDEIGVAVGRGLIDGKLVIIAVQEFGSLSSGNKTEKKEENNIPDSKPKNNDGQGIVLNMDGSKNGSSGTGGFDSFNKLGGSKPKLNLSGFKEVMSNPWFVSMSIILALCLALNFAVLVIIFLHHASSKLRKSPETFKMVHTVIILLLIASITL